MTKNISNTLDIEKVTSALAKRLPDKKGPWRYEKTLFGQSNPTFILTGKNSKLVLRKKPSGNLLKSAHMIEREFKVMSALKITDLPVPEMYFLCEDESEIGTPYFVMEYVEGLSFLDPRALSLTIDSRKKVYQENIKGS